MSVKQQIFESGDHRIWQWRDDMGTVFTLIFNRGAGGGISWTQAMMLSNGKVFIGIANKPSWALSRAQALYLHSLVKRS